jgi:hypothetical protein
VSPPSGGFAPQVRFRLGSVEDTYAASVDTVHERTFVDGSAPGGALSADGSFRVRFSMHPGELELGLELRIRSDATSASLHGNYAGVSFEEDVAGESMQTLAASVRYEPTERLVVDGVVHGSIGTVHTIATRKTTSRDAGGAVSTSIEHNVGEMMHYGCGGSRFFRLDTDLRLRGEGAIGRDGDSVALHDAGDGHPWIAVQLRDSTEMLDGEYRFAAYTRGLAGDGRLDSIAAGDVDIDDDVAGTLTGFGRDPGGDFAESIPLDGTITGGVLTANGRTYAVIHRGAGFAILVDMTADARHALIVAVRKHAETPPAPTRAFGMSGIDEAASSVWRSCTSESAWRFGGGTINTARSASTGPG